MSKENGETSFEKDRSVDSSHDECENETSFPNMNDKERGQSNIDDLRTYYSYFSKDLNK